MDKQIIELRKILHNNPERAFKEINTKRIISEFLKENTNFTVVDKGDYIYAFKKSKGNPIAFRCDMDGVVEKGDVVKHLCGHDGHCAIVCALAKKLSTIETDRDVYLIFQPAEENGQGAKICCDLIKEKGINEIYGLHNIPGFEKNTILLKKGCFACGSVGLKIRYIGKPTHAAYPENGLNPTLSFVELISQLENLNKHLKSDNEILMHSYIGLNIGSDYFGVNGYDGYLNITVRAENQDLFEKYIYQIKQKANLLASNNGLRCVIEEFDYFPSTINDDKCVEKVLDHTKQLKLDYQILSQPMRWSEDFGYYLQCCKGCFFGIGDGLNWPGLHTENYSFPDEIIDVALDLFTSLV